MQDLYACADIIIGRGGAVSIAEFTAAGEPVICLPYPWHKDRHQYLNAEELCQKGAAVIVDDTPQTPQKTAKALSDILIDLMKDESRLDKMTHAAANNIQHNAAKQIAETISD